MRPHAGSLVTAHLGSPSSCCGNAAHQVSHDAMPEIAKLLFFLACFPPGILGFYESILMSPSFARTRFVPAMSRFVSRALFAICGVFTALALCHARSLFVSLDGDDTTGADWDTAYTSINYAVSLMMDEPHEAGDTIYMKEGVYLITNTVVITNHPLLNIFGGYEGVGLPGEVGTNYSLIQRDPTYTPLQFRVVLVTNSMVNWKQVGVSGGYLLASGATTHGTGLYAVNCTSSFDNCIIANTWVSFNSAIFGHGLYAEGGILRMNNCFVTNNYRADNWWWEAGYGGGVAALNANVVISNTVFDNNRMRPRGAYRLFGGGIYLSGGSAVIDNCVFSTNWFFPQYAQEDYFRGAGLYAGDVNPLTIKDCTFINNGMSIGAYQYNWLGSAMWLSGASLDATISRVKIISCSPPYDLNSYVIYMPSGKAAFSDITMISNTGCVFFSIT